MNHIIFDILKTSMYVSIPIILISLFKDRILNKYTYKLNYILSILITLRMIFISQITIAIPYKFLKTQANLSNPTISDINYLSNKVVNSLNYIQIIFIIWIIGFVYVLFKNIYNHYIFLNKIKNLTYEITDLSIIDCLEEEKKLLNIKKDIEVLKVDGLSSPTLINVFNSKIIIPNKDYEIKELKWIFRHELTHFQRRDNLLKLILIIGSSIHWFNPLVKILKVYFNEQCELSCDEKILKEANTSDTKDYALILLNTLKYRNYLKSTMLYSQFNTNQIDLIKRRVEGMMNLKKRRKGILVTIAVSAVSIFSIITFNINNEDSSVYADESLTYKEQKSSEKEDNKPAASKKNMSEEEIINNLKNVKESDMQDVMEFYQDRKFEDLTQEEINYALEFLFTGKCKQVNIGSDATYRINLDNLKQNNKI